MKETKAQGITGLFVFLVFLWLMPSVGKAFEFGVIGCQQYSAESEAKFPNLMSDLNQFDLAFVVHVGDIKGGRASCSDKLFQSRKEQFQASKHPFIYTPGDNEWTDCYRERAGGHDPLERLAQLRKLFFQGSQSLGQRKLTLTRQSNDPKYAKFRENVHWTYESVFFLTLHVVGSNNNLGRTPEADAEYQERNAADVVWLRQGFDLARRNASTGIVIFTQANPRFEERWPKRRIRGLQIAKPQKRPSGYSDFLSTLEAETLAFGKPVVLVHADTHYFRIDKPMFTSKEAIGGRGRQIENFTRVETFGFPEAHWVRASVDPKNPSVFAFKQQIVKENVVKHLGR